MKIGILCREPGKVLPWLRAVGLFESQVTFGIRSDITLQQAGENWGYVIPELSGGLTIPFPDPRRIFEDPPLQAYILLAFEKAKSLAAGTIHLPLTVTEQVAIARDRMDLEDLFATLASVEEFSLDIELVREAGEISCLGFGWQQPAGIYHATSVPLMVNEISFWSVEDEAYFWLQLQELLRSPKRKVLQNFMFDCLWLSRLGLEINGPIVDTMVLAHLRNPELPKSLEALGAFYLVCEPWKNSIVNWTSEESLWTYNAFDCLRTLQICHKLEALLRQSPLAWGLLNEQLIPLSLEVLRMCERGWTVDHAAIEAMKVTLNAELAALKAQMEAEFAHLLPPTHRFVQRKGKARVGSLYFQKSSDDRMVPLDVPAQVKRIAKNYPFPVFEKIEVKKPFNPNSGDQMKAIMTALGVTIPISRKTKRESLDKKALLKIQKKQPLAVKLLQYRRQMKMLTSYANVALDPDGKLRFQIGMAGGSSDGDAEKDDGGTVTSRFSCRKTPWGTGLNGQTLPERFRHILLPSQPGWEIVNLDFKQADPHCVAWLAGEESMLRELSRPGADLHALTGSLMAGFDITAQPNYDKDTDPWRKKAKAANNGLNYYLQVKTFAADSGMTLDEAKAVYDAYFRAYPGIAKWHEQTERTLHTKRELTTPFGRKRHFYGNYFEKYARVKLLQNALAYVPPTVVADALNCGWLRFAALARSANIPFNVLIQCHDSLTIEIPSAQFAEIKALILRAYGSVRFALGAYPDCCIPIDIKRGPNWGSLEAA